MMKQLEYTDYQPVQKKYPLSILLDNITTPQNVGAIFRIADTFGIEGLVMCETTPVPPHKRINSGGSWYRKNDSFHVF
ncbi:MAG: TrmH family RNA methyltransferase [Saprospiraceae bacterium]|nr:TrmH family RNA methyltransferase [Saprospiraceae bacterium]